MTKRSHLYSLARMAAVAAALAIVCAQASIGRVPDVAKADTAGPILPVIFLHGIDSSYTHWVDNGWATVASSEKSQVDQAMKGLPYRLYRAESNVFDGIGSNTPVFMFDLSNFEGAHGDIYLAAGMLKQAIDTVKSETGASDVYLVGYSMGGVISRAYLEDKAKVDDGSFLFWKNWSDVSYDNDVWGLTTLDTPHKGSGLCGGLLAGAIEHAKPAGWDFSLGGMWAKLIGSDPAEDQLESDSGFIKDLNSASIPDETRCAFLVGAYYDFIGDGLLNFDEQITNSSVRKVSAPRLRWEPVVHSADMENEWWNAVLSAAGQNNQHKDTLLGEVMETKEAKDFVRSSYAWAYSQYEAEPIASDSVTSIVIDVSASMDDSFEGGTKLDAAKEAAETVSDIIYGYYENQSGHADVGIAAFSDDSFEVLSPTDDIVTVEGEVEGLASMDNTNLRAAIDVGVQQLASFTTQDRAMFLLSDGQDTVGNTYDEIMAAADRASAAGIRVYTVGFGDPGALDEPTLQEIASRTGGEYQWADPSMAFSVIEQFAQSQANRSGGDVLLSTSGTVALAQTALAGIVNVPDASGLLETFLYWPGSNLEVRLTDPSGREVTEGYPGMQVIAKGTQSQVFVQNAMPGDWEFHVYGAETSMPEEPFYALASFRESTGTPPASGGGGAPSSDGSELWVLLLGLLGAGGIALVFLGRKKSTAGEPDALAALATPSSTAVATASVNGPHLAAKDGARYALKQGANAIGRAADNDVSLQYESVSRHHALLVLEGSAVTVRDLESTQGTSVNGSKRRESSVRDGDVLAFGSVELTLRLPSQGSAK